MQLAFFSIASSCVPLVDNPFPFSPGFDISLVSQLAGSLPSHSWEHGTASQALLELHNSSLSVFGCDPFRSDLDPSTVKALRYAQQTIVISEDAKNALADGDGAVGDPASLGVSALMLGGTIPMYRDAAERQLDYVVYDAPKYWNGAISHRPTTPSQLRNLALLQHAIDQCRLYRDILNSGDPTRLWKHIINPSSTPDPGLWSTGNAWVAAGMTRVLATVMKAPEYIVPSDYRETVIAELTVWIKEILDAAMGSTPDQGLLPNYLNDDGGHWFGEISGSSLLAAVAYRMAVLQPNVFGGSGSSGRYTAWADGIRGVLGGNDEGGNPHVTSEGVVTPAVNPLNWGDRTPFTTGSPEGQNFVVLMYAAWRDCVLDGKCREPVEYGVA
ncbi:hypothetical protein AAF712_003495 [Marasmius tenuissimus]|uniref:Uncharacterized protein n=1 Tax=Marasmius tenuissimus TaxID=585030 RepID=A0ABR3AA89_9AGAR